VAPPIGDDECVPSCVGQVSLGLSHSTTQHIRRLRRHRAFHVAQELLGDSSAEIAQNSRWLIGINGFGVPSALGGSDGPTSETCSLRLPIALEPQ
jgi:hypothetical protein